MPKKLNARNSDSYSAKYMVIERPPHLSLEECGRIQQVIENMAPLSRDAQVSALRTCANAIVSNNKTIRHEAEKNACIFTRELFMIDSKNCPTLFVEIVAWIDTFVP